jgi:hypothetical protein
MSHQENTSPSEEPEKRRGELIGGEQQPQSQGPDPETDTGKRRAQSPSLPTKEELLGRLNHLSFLTITKIVPSPIANSVHGMLRTLLGALNTTQPGGKGQVSDATLFKALREAPHLLEFFKDVMSPEQYEMLMKDFRVEP